MNETYLKLEYKSTRAEQKQGKLKSIVGFILDLIKALI